MGPERIPRIMALHIQVDPSARFSSVCPGRRKNENFLPLSSCDKLVWSRHISYVVFCRMYTLSEISGEILSLLWASLYVIVWEQRSHVV